MESDTYKINIHTRILTDRQTGRQTGRAIIRIVILKMHTHTHTLYGTAGKYCRKTFKIIYGIKIYLYLLFK